MVERPLRQERHIILNAGVPEISRVGDDAIIVPELLAASLKNLLLLRLLAGFEPQHRIGQHLALEQHDARPRRQQDQVVGPLQDTLTGGHQAVLDRQSAPILDIDSRQDCCHDRVTVFAIGDGEQDARAMPTADSE